MKNLKKYVKVQLLVAATLLSLAAIGCGNESASGPVVDPGLTPPTGKIMFVTASSYDGNLGGIVGADAKCMADTNKPSGAGNYKAFIFGTNGSSTIRFACNSSNCSAGVSTIRDWVLSPNTNYIRQDGTLIGTTNSAAIFSLPLNASIVDIVTPVWTGSTSDWENSDANCTNWTVGTSSATAVVGNAKSKDSTFLNDTSPYCSEAQHLICVQQ